MGMNMRDSEARRAWCEAGHCFYIGAPNAAGAL